MGGESRIVDLHRSALLRLLDRLDLAPDDDARTLYLTPVSPAVGLEAAAAAAIERLPDTGGCAVFWGPAASIVVSPPFPIEKQGEVSGYQTAPLRELLNRPRTLGVILMRLGGYSAGIYRDGTFVDTKTGGRFVKNRHRKGGQSQRRFERIREGQIREHFDDVAAVVRTKLLPAAADLDFVVLGGDRRTIQAWLKRAPLPDALAAKLLPRTIDMPEPRLEVLQRTPAAIWTSRAVIEAAPPAVNSA